MTKHFDVCIFSMRVVYGGYLAANTIRTWLKDNGMPIEAIDKLEFPKEKPNAIMFIDHRVYRFEGIFPTQEQIINSKPWNKL